MTTPTDAAGRLGSGGLAAGACFGEGGGRPYERALELGGAVLHLRPHPAPSTPADGGGFVDVGRFLGRADRVDRAVLRRTAGAVLDVGCGPGRMVAEARRVGRPALGIDVSARAVALAAERGLPVVQTSVFGAVPHEGGWDTVLLLDGNVGIGGDPPRLLARCAGLLAPGGILVVETHPDPEREHVWAAVLVDGSGVESSPFPWAELGAHPLRRHVSQLQWPECTTVRRRGRRFLLLRRGGGR